MGGLGVVGGGETLCCAVCGLDLPRRGALLRRLGQVFYLEHVVVGT